MTKNSSTHEYSLWVSSLEHARLEMVPNRIFSQPTLHTRNNTELLLKARWTCIQSISLLIETIALFCGISSRTSYRVTIHVQTSPHYVIIVYIWAAHNIICYEHKVSLKDDRCLVSLERRKKIYQQSSASYYHHLTRHYLPTQINDSTIWPESITYF